MAESRRTRRGAAQVGSAKQRDDEEEEEWLGQLEAYVRVWLPESCLEALADGSPAASMAVVMGPLLFASSDPGGKSGYVMIAMAANAIRRLRRGRVWEAIVDATTLAGLFVERSGRSRRKPASGGELEAEAVATCAETVRDEMVVASAALAMHALWLLRDDPKALAVAAAPAILALAAYRRWSRPATLGLLLADLARLVSSRRPELFPPAAASRLFFVAPPAFTDALDEWIFMDFLFGAVCLFAFCLALKRDLLGDHGNAALVVPAHAAYLLAIALLTARALLLDRATHADLRRHHDRPLKRNTQRALHYDFAQDRARLAFALVRRRCLAVSLLWALLHLCLALPETPVLG